MDALVPRHPGDAHGVALAVVPVIVVTVLAFLSVIARWATRVLLLHHVGKEDYIIVGSLMVSFAMTAVITAQYTRNEDVTFGAANATSAMRPITAKLLLASNILYHATVNLTKASIITQYHFIFYNSDTVRRLCYCLYAFILVAAAWGIIGGATVCVPIARYWSANVPGSCMSFNAYWISSATLNFLADIFILVLPMPVVSRLHLPRRQLISVIMIFGIGVIVCVVAGLRITLVQAFTARKEGTSAGVAAVIWSAVEANVGIICACAMALKPLVLHFFPRLFAYRPTKPSEPVYSDEYPSAASSNKQAKSTSPSMPSTSADDLVDHDVTPLDPLGPTKVSWVSATPPTPAQASALARLPRDRLTITRTLAVYEGDGHVAFPGPHADEVRDVTHAATTATTLCAPEAARVATGVA